MDASAHDRIYNYRSSEFVVASPYLELVLSYLDCPVRPAHDTAPELGLTLVYLTDVDETADKLRARRENAHIKAPVLDADLASRRPLERVLAELRALIGHRYGGWVPDLGKNRVMQGLHLFPYPDFSGTGAPTALKSGMRLETMAKNPEAGRHARVVILDTAIAPNEQLAGRYVTADAGSLLDKEQEQPWWTGHATFLSGLVVQRAPGARIEVGSILRSDGNGAEDIWHVARQLVRYADSGADVLNLSFGCFTVDGQPPLVLERAIGRLTPRMVVVAAAGNYGKGAADDKLPGPSTPVWPAAFPDVVAVGAADESGKPADFSPQAPWVDLLAPGVNVRSTYLTGKVTIPDSDVPQRFHGMAEWVGTSHAAAAVSGALAARTERGKRTAYDALRDLRKGVDDPSSTGIEVAPPPEP